MFESMIGLIAGILGVSGFAFQLYKMIKTKETKAISYNLLIFTGFAMSMWMLYGFEKNNPVIFVPNLILLGILIGMSCYNLKREKLSKIRGLVN